MGEPTVNPRAPTARIALDARSWVDVTRAWLHGADTLLDELAERVPWRQGRRWMYERAVNDPRLSRWYNGDETLPHPMLDDIRTRLSANHGVPYRSVGCNYYRDGRDSVAFHADRELRHLDETMVSIVTLGAARPFLIRPRNGGDSIDVRPASGDLLVMGGACQRHWEHAVPKAAHAGPRISISVRWSTATAPVH